MTTIPSPRIAAASCLARSCALAASRPSPDGLGPILVAIPVKDEAERIADCLRALTFQQDRTVDGVVLLVNDTTDATAGIVRDLLPHLPVPVEVIEHRFAPGSGSAGRARRLAMEHAAGRLGAHGVLLTTDADGNVPPDWVAANAWHLRRGIDAVAGQAKLDPREAALIPKRLHDDDARECAYATLLDEITALLDPDPWDPWPRHTEHSGASIAVMLTAYRRAGGMPGLALGEDRGFFDALRRTGARIRHAPEIAVVVSGRVMGRAPGGMADTIRRRLSAPDPFIDDTLEPVAVHARRAWLRHRFRSAWANGQADDALRGVCRDLGVLQTQAAPAPHERHGMEVWARLEASSPVLAREPVAAADLLTQTVAAHRLTAGSIKFSLIFERTATPCG